MNTIDCYTALLRFEEHQFSDWSGLTADCTPTMIATKYGGADFSQAGSTWRGEKNQNVSFVSLAITGYKEPAQLLFRNDTTVCLEVKYPKLDDLNSIIASLGKPEAMLDYYFDVLLNENGEYVFCKKGITLFMNSTRENVVKIWVYEPMELQEYRDKLHYLEPPREFPYYED